MDNQGLEHITEIEIKLQKAESTIYKLEKELSDLTTLLEHYEKINNKRIRKNILAHQDAIDNMY